MNPLHNHYGWQNFVKGLKSVNSIATPIKIFCDNSIAIFIMLFIVIHGREDSLYDGFNAMIHV